MFKQFDTGTFVTVLLALLAFHFIREAINTHIIYAVGADGAVSETPSFVLKTKLFGKTSK
jgi:hypothetical protein